MAWAECRACGTKQSWVARRGSRLRQHGCAKCGATALKAISGREAVARAATDPSTPDPYAPALPMARELP